MPQNPDHPRKPGRPPLPDSERADSKMVFRVTRARKAAYVRASNAENTTLAAWTFAHLDRASGYHEKE